MVGVVRLIDPIDAAWQVAIDWSRNRVKPEGPAKDDPTPQFGLDPVAVWLPPVTNAEAFLSLMLSNRICYIVAVLSTVDRSAEFSMYQRVAPTGA